LVRGVVGSILFGLPAGEIERSIAAGEISETPDWVAERVKFEL
jgi:hypothetical protein